MTILIDIDGTLTDGKMYIDHKGEKMFKAFHSRDVRAIRELIYNGFEVVLVSADDHESNGYFAQKVGAIYKYERDKSLLFADYCIGDDAWDIPMMKNCNNIFCPSDADLQVQAMPGMNVLKAKGGQGVIALFVNLTLSYGHLLSTEDKRQQAR